MDLRGFPSFLRFVREGWGTTRAAAARGGFYKRGYQDKILHLFCRGKNFLWHSVPVGSYDTFCEGMVVFSPLVGGSPQSLYFRPQPPERAPRPARSWAGWEAQKPAVLLLLPLFFPSLGAKHLRIAVNRVSHRQKCTPRATGRRQALAKNIPQ